MEMYFFDRAALDKFLTVLVRGFPKDAARVQSEIENALQEMFLVRLADHVLRWNLDVIPFLDFCSTQDDGVRFQNEEYVLRMLTANGKAGQKQRFLEEIARLRGQLSEDPRNQIHGHDFTALLSWYVRDHGRSGVNQTFVERALPGCRDYSSLMQEGLFRGLLDRVRGPVVTL